MSIRIPFMSRRSGGQDTGQSRDIPWWVPIFTDWGRPLAAVVVLVLCAPGEKHLADLVGWDGWLTWLWAGLLSLYAGISAVVATVRPRGSRGKATAVLGAALSLALAMAAQPISHMFTTGYLTAEPRPPLWLVIVVSGIPPFILGHLLHLAASSVRPSAGQTDKVSRPVRDKRATVVPVPSWATEEKARRTAGTTGQDTPTVSLRKPDKAVRPVLVADTDSGRTAGTSVPSLADKQNLSARALELASAGQDKDTIKDTLRTEFPDAKADSVRKAANRAADKVSAAS